MPAHSPGVFVSGFHEQWPILHAEAAYGLARTGQTIVNVPVHVACAAGVWQALVFGFGGVREYDCELSITPHLPISWTSLAFSLRFRGRRLQIHFTHDQETYTIESGDPLQLTIHGQRHTLAAGTPLTRSASPPSP